MTAGIGGSAYYPSKRTLERLEKLGEELGTASPMKFLAKMRIAGFSTRAIAEKMEMPTNTVRRLLDNKKVPKTKIAVMGGVGNSRPWKAENKARRTAAITAGIRAKKKVHMWDENTTLAEHLESTYGFDSKDRKKHPMCKRIYHRIRVRGLSVQDAVVQVMSKESV